MKNCCRIISHVIVWVFPSLIESFGLPLIEATIFGKPLICNNTLSTSEVVSSYPLAKLLKARPLDSTLKHIAKFNVAAPKVYTGSERAFEQMLNNEEFDCVIIASPWEWHVPMSVAAMKAKVPYEC